MTAQKTRVSFLKRLQAKGEGGERRDNCHSGEQPFAGDDEGHGFQAWPRVRLRASPSSSTAWGRKAGTSGRSFPVELVIEPGNRFQRVEIVIAPERRGGGAAVCEEGEVARRPRGMTVWKPPAKRAVRYRRKRARLSPSQALAR